MAARWAFRYSYGSRRRNLTRSSQSTSLVAEHSNERERERDASAWNGSPASRRTAGGRGYQIPVRWTVLQITRIGIEGITKNSSFSFIHVHTQLLQAPSFFPLGSYRREYYTQAALSISYSVLPTLSKKECNLRFRSNQTSLNLTKFIKKSILWL